MVVLCRRPRSDRGCRCSQGGLAAPVSESNVDRVIVFCDDAGQWCWHGVAGNGEIVAEGESHTRPEDAARAARGVLGENVNIVLEREG